MRLTAALFLVSIVPTDGIFAQSAAQGALSDVPGSLIEAAPQIASQHDRDLSGDQVTTERKSDESVTQVTRPGRTAQPSPSLSERSAGRTGEVERVEGKDRCDAATPKAKRSAACNNILEARAHEFERGPKNELSPEQRLLLTREIQGAGSDITEATRRLAQTGEADDSLDSMGVASIVLDQSKPLPPPKPDKPGGPVIDEQTQAIINAIVIQPQE